MKHAHWVFDLDGTIINSSGYYERSIDAILRGFGILPTPYDIDLAYKYFNPQEYFATYFDDPEKVADGVQQLIELNHQYASEIPLFEGIAELFALLKKKRVKISVWTGRDLGSAQKILASSGLALHVESCVGRTCVPRNKPYPDGLFKILKESASREAETLMIGDHEYDMQAAKLAGVEGVSVGWDRRAHPGARDLSSIHFDRVADLHAWAEQNYF